MDKFNLFFNNVKTMLATDTAHSLTLIAIASVIIFIWIGLAAFAASYVELRGGANGSTFTLGLLFPVVAPLLAITMTKGRENRELFVAGDLVHSYDYQNDESSSDDSPEEGESEQNLDDENFDMKFFKLKLKTLGANQTYQLSMGGRLVTVNRILDCLPNVLLAEMIDEENNTQRMRIPYAKIQGVRY